jgi:hypothetical protein
MKDLIDEIDSRIKSPLFGYFILSSIAINWEELFYLSIHNGSVPDRIDYFNNGTDLWSLFIYPLVLASVYSILYPWLQFIFVFFGTKPTELQNNLQAQSEHRLIIEKQKLEKARSELLEDAEIELIDRAKRDVELDDIEDTDVREKLQLEIESLREERDGLRGTIAKKTKVTPPTLSPEQDDILQMITKNGGKALESHIIETSKYNKVKAEYLLEDLLEKQYLSTTYDPDFGQIYSLTTKSKKIMIDRGYVN